jgi:predicted nucleotidyltransferase
MGDVQEALKNLVERLHEAAKDNLESIILYGSAARGDFRDAHSDLNVLCILRSLRAVELARVSPVVKWWTTTQLQPAPLFFSAEELRQSADVFAIELLDMQQSHRVLYGSDSIASTTVPMNLHRVQVEHELSTLLLKLRHHFLREAGNQQELGAVLAKSFSSALTLLRHTLIAFQEQPPSAPGEVFARIAALTGASAPAFQAVRRLREANSLDRDAVLPVYDGYLAALEKVIAALDHHLPKRQWQRSGKNSSELLRRQGS